MRRHTFSQILFSITAFLPLLQIGTWLGYLAVVVPKLRSNDPPIVMTEEEISWMVAFTDIGGFLSPFPAGFLMDRFGRLSVLRLAFILYISSVALILAATAPYHMCLAAFLTGLAYGIAFAAPVLYVAEIAKPKIRGSLGGISVFMMSGAQAVTMTFGPWVSFKCITWLIMICPLVGFFLTFFMVESPYYHCIQNDEVRAKAALGRLRNRAKTNEKDVELESMRKKVDENLKDSRSFFELITQKSNARAFLIVLVLAAVRSGGVVPITVYASGTLPREPWDPRITMTIFAWLNVVSSIFGMSLVDRFGRKPLLVISLVGLSAVTGASAVFYYLWRRTSVDVSEWLFVPHVGVFLFGVFFQVGVGLVPQILRGELFSVRIKSTASAIAVMVQSATICVNNKISPTVHENIGVYFMYAVFSSINLVVAIFAVIFVFETKGKTLEEIQELLSR